MSEVSTVVGQEVPAVADTPLAAPMKPQVNPAPAGPVKPLVGPQTGAPVGRMVMSSSGAAVLVPPIVTRRTSARSPRPAVRVASSQVVATSMSRQQPQQAAAVAVPVRAAGGLVGPVVSGSVVTVAGGGFLLGYGATGVTFVVFVLAVVAAVVLFVVVRHRYSDAAGGDGR